MRRTITAATAALLALGLSSCGGSEAPAQSSTTGSGAVSSAPQSIPGEAAPSESEPEAASSAFTADGTLDKASAGELYLAAICDTNAAGSGYNDAIAAANDVANTGGDPDITPVQAAAAEASRRDMQAVTLLDDTYYQWPAEVSDHLRAVRDSFMTNAGEMRQVSAATNWEGLTSVLFTQTDAGIAQEVRYQLGILADTPEGSCEGRTGQLDALAAESEARKAS